MELNDSTPLAWQWRDETDSEPEFGEKILSRVATRMPTAHRSRAHVWTVC